LAPTEADTFGLDIDVQPLREVTILGYEMEPPPVRPAAGLPPDEADRRKKTYTMPYYADFVAKRSVAFLCLSHPAGLDRCPGEAPPTRLPSSA